MLYKLLYIFLTPLVMITAFTLLIIEPDLYQVNMKIGCITRKTALTLKSNHETTFFKCYSLVCCL